VSYCRLGSLDVLSLRLVFELAGPGRADLEVSLGDDPAPAEGSALTLTVGSRSFAGTVLRATNDNGRGRVAWVQGAGKWATVLAPRAYRDVLVRVIAEQLCADAGETISAATLQALPDIVLGYWHRHELPAGQCMSALASYAGLGWRVGADGSVTLAAEPWPTAPITGLEPLADDGADGAVSLSAAAPTVLPGMTYGGRRIERVVYTMTEEGSDLLSALLTFVRSGAPATTRAAFEAAVRAAVSELHHLPRYGARVVAQAADGRLELEPDAGQGQAGTGAVPVLYGLPGVRCEVPAGSRVGLAYEAGRRDQPRAMGWEQETPAAMIEVEAGEIRLGEDALLGVVRTTDLGDAGTLAVGVGPVSLVYTGPDGSAWSLTLAAGATPVTAVIAPLTPTTTPGKLTTKAVGCSEKVKAT
jgi:hypothetical protein